MKNFELFFFTFRKITGGGFVNQLIKKSGLNNKQHLIFMFVNFYRMKSNGNIVFLQYFIQTLVKY